MDKVSCLLFAVLILAFLACNTGAKTKSKTDLSILDHTSNLELDHVNIWVQDPDIAKEQLLEIGFTSVPDSLSSIHEGQGTAGRYFYFLNGYLELIFVHDQDELLENSRRNAELDFVERAESKENGASPFSVALKLKEYRTEEIPFEKVSYHQAWMKENRNIYAARNSKKNLGEPSLFVVYPEIEADGFETLDDLKNIPEEYSIWREFFKHPNGAKRITRIQIKSPDLDLETETMKSLNGIESVSAQRGTEHLMELDFDDRNQNKSFDLRPELPLIVNF